MTENLFDGHSAILGRVGSGKTFAARGIVEGWLELKRRVCIIDPTCVWHGLRSNAAGTGPGYPVVIFGGERGDVPIGARSGERVAEIVGTRNMPAVIATGDMTGGERHQFMTDFLQELFRVNRASLHLVVDEADEVGPQNALPESRRMLGAFERIVRRGRVRGFQVMMITQRPAVLNKNLLSQADTLVAMRLPAPQDRKAVEAWISSQADTEQAKEMMASLPGLKRGEGWVWSPQNDVLRRQTFPMITTFDSMRTPEHGEIAEEPTTLAPVEVGDLLGLLVDPEDQTSEQKTTKPSQEQLHLAEKRGYDLGYTEGLAKGEAAGFSAAVTQMVGKLNELAVGAPARSYPYLNASNKPEIPIQAPRETKQRAAPAANELHGAARKLLAASAQHSPAVFTWGQLATLAGLKASGGHFNSGRKQLLDLGLVCEMDGIVGPTPEGLAAAGEVPAAPSTPRERLSLWCSRLPGAAPSILAKLVEHGGAYISAEQIATELGRQPTGGYWNAGVSVLRNNGLIEAQGRTYRASDLFLGE